MVSMAEASRMWRENAGPHVWRIDVEMGYDPTDGRRTEAGTVGPSGVSDNLLNQILTGCGQQFRMCYADGEVAYEGRFIGEDDDKEMPLLDFGTPNARCSYIEYRTESGEWEEIG